MPAYASTPWVGFGRTPESQVVGESECTAVESAARWCRRLTTLKRSRYGSSGFMMSLNSKSRPTVSGVNRAITAPCGT